MGNVLSLHHISNDERLHVCDRCGFWTKHKSALRCHKSHSCRVFSDGRYKRGRSVIVLEDPHEHSHEHHHHVHDGAEHDGMASGADADAEEQLRDAVNYQLEQYMQTSGEDLPPDAVAGLSDLLVDILGNDAQDDMEEAVDDYLEELRDLLGVPEHPADDQPDDDDAPDSQSKQELQRLLSHLHDPVTPGSTYTLLQTVIIELAIKRRRRITDGAFEDLCRFQHAMLPAGNFYPRSLWLMKKVAGVEDARKIQVHMCVNDCKTFTHLEPRQYRQHALEVCEHCKERRFEVKKVGDCNRIVPRKVMYWFGVAAVIRDRLFTDPSFCKHRTTGRDQYFYPSPEAARLARASGFDINRRDVSCYEVGMDFAQMFSSKVHSSGFIMMRCADMPLTHLNRRRFSHVVGIIPGPKEPADLDPYLEKLVEEFKQYGPAGQGLQVTEYKLDAANKVERGASFKHTILLSGVFGDSPATKKLAHWLSHAAYLGCGYCLLRGRVPDGGSGMYFGGYAADTSYGAFKPNEVKHYGAHSEYAVGMARCGDDVAALTHQQQCARAKAVDQNKVLPTDVGSHGTSPFVRGLDYVDYNNLFVVPIAHAGLLGVVKDFWYHVLKATGKNATAEWFTISNEARRVMSSREACLVPTCDFGRKYTDIISKKGNWVMEDWLHWAECWSVFVLRPYVVDGEERHILHPQAASMWQHLRAGLLYFCRSHPVDGVAQDVDEAMAELQQYAVAVEQHFGLSMCKFNLHLLVCRIAKQEAARGRAAHSTEYWLENLIQWAKSTVRYRTTKYPELVLANDLMLDDAIARCTAEHDVVRAKLADWEHKDGLGASHSHPDDGACDGSQLLGRGRLLTRSERVTMGVDAAVDGFIEGFSPDGWTSDLAEGSEIFLYTYAQAAGSELLHSTMYTRARSRVSYNALCQFWEGERGEPEEGASEEPEVPTDYIGKILCFVKVIPPAVTPQAMDIDPSVDQGGLGAVKAEPLRLAIMDLHVLQRVDAGVGMAFQSVTYATGFPAYSSFALSLSADDSSWGSMYHKLAMATADGVAFFLPYSNMSASGEDD